ncbi:unnamed protein product, partial [Callosobruchus maculatus]
ILPPLKPICTRSKGRSVVSDHLDVIHLCFCVKHPRCPGARRVSTLRFCCPILNSLHTNTKVTKSAVMATSQTILRLT